MQYLILRKETIVVVTLTIGPFEKVTKMPNFVKGIIIKP